MSSNPNLQQRCTRCENGPVREKNGPVRETFHPPLSCSSQVFVYSKLQNKKTYSKTVFVKISELTYIYDSKSAQKVSMFFNLFKHMSLKTSGTVPVSGILVLKKLQFVGKTFLRIQLDVTFNLPCTFETHSIDYPNEL